MSKTPARKRLTVRDRADGYAKLEGHVPPTYAYLDCVNGYMAGYRAAQRDAKKKGRKR